MSNSKIEIKIGDVEFQLEGENQWVDSQINNLLDRLVPKAATPTTPAKPVEKATPAPKKVEAKKPVAKKAEPKKEAPKKAEAKKAEPKKVEAKKPAAKAPAPKKEEAKKVETAAPKAKAPAKKAPAKKSTPKKATPKKAAAKAKPTPKATATKAKAKAEARVGADADTSHPLFNYLKTKNAMGNQVRRFLATSAFLAANGEARLSTSMVAEITKAAGLAKFANASDCLNKNEKKGYCIKEGKQFVVTTLGVESLMS